VTLPTKNAAFGIIVFILFLVVLELICILKFSETGTILEKFFQNFKQI
jgi:hypothetical protein